MSQSWTCHEDPTAEGRHIHASQLDSARGVLRDQRMLLLLEGGRKEKKEYTELPSRGAAYAKSRDT